MKEIAIIQRNKNGGHSLLLPGAGREIGNYDTSYIAAKVARLNGYLPEVHAEDGAISYPFGKPRCERTSGTEVCHV